LSLTYLSLVFLFVDVLEFMSFRRIKDFHHPNIIYAIFLFKNCPRWHRSRGLKLS